MKTTVSIYDFMHTFESCRPNNFSREGLTILFDYLEAYEQDIGEELELDVIALCCEYSEDSIQQIIDSYDIDVSKCDDGICTASAHGLEQVEQVKREAVRDYLESHTSVCGETSDGFVYAQF